MDSYMLQVVNTVRNLPKSGWVEEIRDLFAGVEHSAALPAEKARCLCSIVACH